MEAATNAKKKSRTQNTLVEKSALIPHFLTTDLFASRAYLIKKDKDLKKICKT